MNRVVYDGLQPAAWTLAVFFVLYAIGHVLLLPPRAAGPLAITALATALELGVLALVLRRWGAPQRWAQPLAALIAGLAMVNALLHLALVGEPRLTTNLVLTLIAAGLFFLSWRWLAVLVAVTWAGFAAIVGSAAASPEWAHFGFALAAATMLAVIVHAARMRAYDRIESMRVRADARHRALLETARALAQSERRHRDIVEHGLGLIATHDLAGVILSLNPAASSALGRAATEVVGGSLAEIVAPDFRPQLEAYLDRMRQDGHDGGVMGVVTSAGEERLVAYDSVVRERSDHAPYVLVHAHDITDRVRLENSLRAAGAELEQRIHERTAALEAANAALRAEVEERRRIGDRLLRYARALETCSDAIALAELDGTIVDANAALLLMSGVADKAALVGRKVVELLAPEDRERALGHSEHVVGKGAVTAREYLLLLPGGPRVPIEATIAPICDDQGARLGLVVVARDVSERKRMETALRHNEAYLRTLIENSADVILVLDSDGTILARPNSEFSTVGPFGYRENGVVGRFAADFIHPEDRHAIAHAFLAASAASRASAAAECRVRDSTGEWRAAEIMFRNLLDEPTVAGLVCTVRDLSARKQAEEELRRAKEAAEAADLAKSEFLATMSHELRTPIHAIIGYAEMLREEALGPLAAEQAEALQQISERAHDQYELISAVLDLSAMETGRMIVEARPVVLAEVFRQVELEGREAWGASGLDVVWRATPGLPAISSDPGKIKLIVRNLVSNAVKFTARGSVTIDAARAGAGIEIRVTDTGIGIPAEAHELIFEPFRQLDGSETRHYEGMGLGLHIVKRLLALLGGSISVQSEVGRGSTFVVWLPIFPRVGASAGAEPGDASRAA